MTRTPLISRRTLLRGAGAALSLPLLEAMLPTASAADVAARPRRLQALYSPNGMIMENYVPVEAGRDFPLSPTLQPFAPFKDRMTVISGLGYAERADGHAQGCSGFLTGAVPRPTEGADIHCGVSLDQVLANRFADDTLLPSLELGIDLPSTLGSCVPNYSCTYTNTLSWRNETTPLPVVINPRDVFERMFGDGDGSDAAAALVARQRRQSILDFVRDDAARLSRSLGMHDRRKIDQYLESVRDVERCIQRAQQQNVDAWAEGVARPAGVPAEFAEHVKMMMDLQVLAMQADITRVGTFMIGREVSNRTYPEVGVTDAHHMLSHHAGDPDKIARISAINRLHMQHFAYFLERLASTPDGEGSLLDCTLVMVGAAFGDPNEHDGRNLPISLFGGGLPGNRHIRLERGTHIARLQLAVLKHFDAGVEEWAGRCDPLTEILSA